MSWHKQIKESANTQSVSSRMLYTKNSDKKYISEIKVDDFIPVKNKTE